MTDQKRRLPNLFLVGAMKSATTSLHKYLDMHPDIFMSKKPKEPDYFVKEINYNKGMDWYLSLFDNAANEKYLGESSTSYTKAPEFGGVPERIHDLCPDAKIIYIMRDPIERAISQYWWEVQYGAEGRTMTDAIKNSNRTLNIGNYVMQIRPYIQLFGAENVYTLTTEELVALPEETMKKIFSWLNVDADYKLADEFKAFNKSKENITRVVGSGFLSSLKETPLWDFLKKIVPSSTRLKILSFVRRNLSKPVDKNDEYRDETIAFLRPIMQKQVQELSELLGREFPEWKTLYGNEPSVKP